MTDSLNGKQGISELPKTNGEKQLNIKNDGHLLISIGNSRKEKYWKTREIKWSTLLEKLRNTRRTSETVEEYKKLPKGEQDDIKDIGGFVGGSLKNGRRKGENIESRSLITLDADFATPNLWDRLEKELEFAFCIYSTHKHTRENPRLRILIPLSRNVTPEEYQAISRRVADNIGMDIFDETTHEPSRLMYWPSTSWDGEYEFHFKDEAWLSPDRVLETYEDWRDTSSWPFSKEGAAVKKHSARQGNPREKKGMVGTFCRTYSVVDAIDKFLSEVYIPCTPDRYTYAKGSTSGGLVIYEEGDFAYSHHGTDPAGGRTLNSFDLVRIHKFGNLDSEAEEGTSVSKLPSYLAMCDFCSSDEKVKITLGREKFQGEEDSSGEGNSDDWYGFLSIDGKGNIKPTIENIRIIITHDSKLKGRIAMNDFSHRIVVRESLPWHSLESEEEEFWGDQDDAYLRHYLETTYGIKGKGIIIDALTVVASDNSYHPIREYFKSLVWDGEKRVERVFIDYLGAEDNLFTRTVTRKSLAAAVARVFVPGIKYDYMVVLAGKQGVGKSKLLRYLGKNWFSDSFTTVKGKEACEQLQGVWLIEVGELSAIRRADSEYVKQFISKQDDIFRVAYGRNTEKFKRQCVFFGTTNDPEFLKDKTGNRRYWPIEVGICEKKKLIKTDLTPYEIDQIWAEAKEIWKEGEELYLEDEEMEKEAVEIQGRFTEESLLKGVIEEYLDMLLPENWSNMDLIQRRMFIHGTSREREEKGTKKRTRVCAMEVWCELLQGDPREMTQSKAKEYNEILRGIKGWKPYSRGSGKVSFGKIYGNQKCYEREETTLD